MRSSRASLGGSNGRDGLLLNGCHYKHRSYINVEVQYLKKSEGATKLILNCH